MIGSKEPRVQVLIGLRWDRSPHHLDSRVSSRYIIISQMASKPSRTCRFSGVELIRQELLSMQLKRYNAVYTVNMQVVRDCELQ